MANVNPESRMLIDGKLVEAEAGKTFTNINPATEEVLGEVADASKADMGRAIAAARRAFEETEWSTNLEMRKAGLQQLQEALEAEREELREQLVLEVGCPRMTTNGPQLDAPLENAIKYPIKLIDEYPWMTELNDEIGLGGTLDKRQIWREATGVVGAIVPWNFPFEVSINKVAQALATGNTVILKPAPDTPWNATFLGRLVAERTDIPPGVLQVVPTSDNMVAEELTLSRDVDIISFTGSTPVGQRIMEKGAATTKRVFLELGGKSANVILEDADFDTALLSSLGACFHSGQGCAIPSRLLLPRSRYEEGIEKVAEFYSMPLIGDPQSDATMGGPLISAKQRDRVMGYIEKGKAEGARLVVGGGPVEGFDKGFYVQATLFADVDNSMTIAQEEIFGPVLVAIPFDDDDDAVRIANDNRYGLAGMVSSGSLERSLAVAHRLKGGMIAVNGAAPYGADLPFGGYKDSGVGRQNGVPGFDQYTEVKSVAFPA